VSKGAQWILYRSRQYDSLTEALADADLSVAMTRWLPDRPKSLPDLPSLLQQPLVQQLLQQPLRQAQQLQQPPLGQGQQQQQPLQQAHHEQQQQLRPVRVALVYGREEFGLSDEEVAACGVACAIPIGRLQVGMCSCQRQRYDQGTQPP
jgi:tRNA C32,U32 (ribose-2'-O)-methylase TrmJ